MFASSIQQRRDMLERDYAARAAQLFGAFPIGNASPVHVSDFSDNGVAAQLSDNAGRGFHVGVVAIFATRDKGCVAILERDGRARPLYLWAMLAEWLRNSLETAEMSQAEFARRMSQALGRSIDRAAVNKMVTGARKISAEELLEAVKILKTTPVLEKDTPVRMVRVAASVQAGHWAETWEWADDDQYEVAVPDDPLLRSFKLYAAETRGTSMNRRYPEGTVVVFTNVMETEESFQAGRRYVVERLRADGAMEHTIKLLHLDDDGKYWLVPESDDPRWQAPIALDDDLRSGDEARIVGRVRYAVTRE